MDLNRTVHRILLSIVTAGLLMESVALADGPPNMPGAATPPVQDVVLLEGNVLLGQLVDAHGRPGAAMDVSVLQNSRVIVTNRTTADGRFAVSGLRSGVYQIATPTSVSTVRLWTREVAPPVADSEAVILCGETIVARRVRRTSWLGILGNPWVMAGITAGAVAIPLAIDDDDNGHTPVLDLPEAS